MSNGYINPTAVIGKEVNLGNGIIIWHFIHKMQNAKVENNCVISDYVYLSKRVSTGNGVKIENRSLYDGVSIEDNVFVGSQCLFFREISILGG